MSRSAGKNITNARMKIDALKSYSLIEGIDLLRSLQFTKFDQTLDIALRLGVDVKRSDQVVRGVVNLPFGTGKFVKVCVFCKDEKISDAKIAGADYAGSVELITMIKSGDIDFDVCISTPDVMGSLAQVAKILGPKGLMPNPKLGTVTNDIEAAIKSAKSGRVEFRTEKGGIVHAGVGKLSFKNDDLVGNVKIFVDTIVKSRPSGAKGNYLCAIYISSTMGPSVKLDISSLIS